jgi:hypothetical protein
MSLASANYQTNSRTFTITCEGPASGLDGIDGKAWLFSVSEPATDTSVNMQAGIDGELLAAWMEATGAEIPNPDLIALLIDHLKFDLQNDRFDPAAGEATEREVLSLATTPTNFAEHRRELDRLLR